MSGSAQQTLGQLRAQFDANLPAGPHGYFAGGACDERVLAANEAAWSDWQTHPQVMVDVSDRDHSTTVLGKLKPHPLIAAPTAYHRLAHAGGEPETAIGCGLADATFTHSTLATTRPGEVSAAAPETSRWFQIYMFRDRAITFDLIDEAVETGFEALVLTVDLPVLGRRERDILSSFEVGDAMTIPGVAASGAAGTVSMQDTADLIDPSLTWSDVANLASRCALPLLVKGILRPDDAIEAIASGAAGVVVSNHGGRQLDSVPATAHVLADIAGAVGAKSTVIVDGGIRRGTDVLTAMTLGADAVMLGRPILWGLAANGAAGVASAFGIVRDEFDRALALSGCPRADSLKGRSDIVRPVSR